MFFIYNFKVSEYELQSGEDTAPVGILQSFLAGDRGLEL